MRTGIAHLPLHYGSAPRWLFQRMEKLAREISQVVVMEFGPEELLQKLSDLFWFQYPVDRENYDRSIQI